VNDTFRPDVAAEQISKLVGWIVDDKIPAARTSADVFDSLVEVTRDLTDWALRHQPEPTDPKEWFDRYISWADQNAQGWPENGQWCPRHWAPCALDGYNGVGASVSIMMAFRSERGDLTPEQLNAEMMKIVQEYGAICCALGDAAMYSLWHEWPSDSRLPGQIEIIPEDQ
jgi:hypothetical protein